MTEDDTSLLALTAQVVSAYVSNNSVQPSALAGLIASVSASLAGLSTPKEEPKPELVPAVSIKKSITPDYLISLEDGRKFKSMKRHLGLLGMTPAEYRAKWSLPSDYPMVSASYAATRSELAKNIGLGRKKASEPEGVPAQEPTAASPPKKRGRKPKAAADAADAPAEAFE